ncbi:MAG: glycosyltransferase family 1 protein [Candidatus Sumerlaeota bacterium]|nr:glycosyltransferase family 1 protein [Candidatus Sumerlaeota bacterium]
MRIAIDARYLMAEFSGIGNYSENLVRHLVAADPDNQYSIFVHQSYSRSLDLPDNAEVIPVPARPVSLYTLFSLGRAVRATGADILHSLFPVTPLFCQIPTLVTVHDLQALMVPEFTGHRILPLKRAYDIFYRWAYPRAIRQARYLIADSHSTRRDMASLIPESRSNTIVIYPGLDEKFGEPVDEVTLRQVNEKYQLPERFILYLGSTRPNKNLPAMIQAFHHMREQYEELKDFYFVLVVAADRFFEDCRRLIKKLRLQKRMRVYKQISELEKRCFYERASALFQVTKYEGFGLPVLEAQVCGLPVLCARHGALPEIAGEGAFVTSPDDQDEIARKMRQLLTDADVRDTLQKAGRRNVQRFTWVQTARSIKMMYDHLF